MEIKKVKRNPLKLLPWTSPKNFLRIIILWERADSFKFGQTRLPPFLSFQELLPKPVPQLSPPFQILLVKDWHHIGSYHSELVLIQTFSTAEADSYHLARLTSPKFYGINLPDFSIEKNLLRRHSIFTPNLRSAFSDFYKNWVGLERKGLLFTTPNFIKERVDVIIQFEKWRHTKVLALE